MLSGGLGRPGAPPRSLTGAGFDGSGLDATVFAGAGFEGAGFDCPAFTGTGFDFDLADAGLRDFELDFFLEAMG